MGLGTLTLWENLCNIIILQFLGCPPGVGMGFDYITSPPLRTVCGSVFMSLSVEDLRIFPGSYQSFSMMVVLQIVVILVCS